MSDSGRGFEGRLVGVAFTPEGRFQVAGSGGEFVCIRKTPEFLSLPPKVPVDDAWRNKVATLPAERRVLAVADKRVDRNGSRR